MSDEHDTWLKTSFGFDIARALRETPQEVDEFDIQRAKELPPGPQDRTDPQFATNENTGSRGHALKNDAQHLDSVHREHEEPLKSQPKGPSSANMPVLREGAKGPAVKDLQLLLSQNGAAVDTDGKFGPNTTKAVKEFQAKAGLAADGVVGPKTWDALSAGRPTPQPPPVPVPTPPAPVPPPGPEPVAGITVLTVTDETTNDAIAKALVQIGEFEETTGNLGEATFTLPPGRHSFVVSADGFVAREGPFNVGGDGDTNVHVELKRSRQPAADHTLTFVAMDDDTGKPIPGAEVSIGGSSGATNRKGEIKVQLPEGSHAFTVVAQGFEPRDGEVDVSGDGDELQHIELLRPTRQAGALFVNVIDKTSRKPVKGASVVIDAGRATLTNGLGSTDILTKLGRHAFEVTATGFKTETGQVEVTADQPAELNVELTAQGESAGSVFVTVIDKKTRKPVKGAKIELGKSGPAATTNSLGSAEILTKTGTRTFSVNAPGFREETGSLEVSRDEPAELMVELTATDPSGKTGSLDLSVVFSDDKFPVPNARVVLEPLFEAQEPPGEQSTDDSGLVHFGALPAGEYSASAQAGEVSAGDQLTIKAGKTARRTIEIARKLEPVKTGKLFVTVVFKDTQEPVKDATVLPNPLFPSKVPKAQQTDGGGHAEFENLLPGKYAVSATVGNLTFSDEVALEAEQTGVLKLEVVRVSQSTETGRLEVLVIRAEDKKPVEGARVLPDPLFPAGRIPPAQASDENGSANFADLQIGDYSVGADLESKGAMLEVSIQANKTTKCSIELPVSGKPRPPQGRVGSLAISVVFTDNRDAIEGARVLPTPLFRVENRLGAKLSDKKGAARFENLPPGEYSASAVVGDQAMTTDQFTIKPDHHTVKTIAISRGSKAPVIDMPPPENPIVDLGFDPKTGKQIDVTGGGGKFTFSVPIKGVETKYVKVDSVEVSFEGTFNVPGSDLPRIQALANVSNKGAGPTVKVSTDGIKEEFANGFVVLEVNPQVETGTADGKAKFEMAMDATFTYKKVVGYNWKLILLAWDNKDGFTFTTVKAGPFFNGKVDFKIDGITYQFKGKIAFQVVFKVNTKRLILEFLSREGTQWATRALAQEAAAAASAAAGESTIASGFAAVTAAEAAVAGLGAVAILAVIYAGYKSVQEIEGIKDAAALGEEMSNSFQAGFLSVYGIKDGAGGILLESGKSTGREHLALRHARALVFFKKKTNSEATAAESKQIRDGMIELAKTHESEFRNTVRGTFNRFIRGAAVSAWKERFKDEPFLVEKDEKFLRTRLGFSETEDLPTEPDWDFDAAFYRKFGKRF